MGVGGQRHAPAALLAGKTRCQLNRRLGRSHGRSGRAWKTSPTPGFDQRTVQPVASRYTDCAIPPPPPEDRSKWDQISAPPYAFMVWTGKIYIINKFYFKF